MLLQLFKMNILKDCQVPHLQNTWEFDYLTAIYERLRPAKVIEIGSFYGATLWAWMRLAPGGNQTTITSIDLPIGPGDGRYNEMLKSRLQWHLWADEYECNLNDWQGDSHSRVMVERVHESHPEKDVDFLFIDGDHSYSGVKADFQNYAQFVRPGGLIVFHDVIGLPEVAKFWNEVKKGQRYQEIYAGNGGWGIGIIEKQ